MTAYEKVKPYIDDSCIEWHPFNVKFDSPDGAFEVKIFAVSFEHASYLLQDLKDTGRIESKPDFIEIKR